MDEYIDEDQSKIETSDEDVHRHNAFSWQPFLRQVYVSSVVMSLYFVLGLSFGAPTVYIPQIRKEENSTSHLTDDMASWLSSILGYSSVPWVIILPILTRFHGRKKIFMFVTISTFVSFIIFYYSTTAMHLLISEILQGITLASNLTLLICIITECSSPSYRGIFLAIENSVFFWGVWIANIIGTFSHWKNIAIVAFVCCSYSMTAVIMPESPSWLAMVGRFEDCAAAHHWLKGYDKKSEEELNNLVQTEKEYLKKCNERQTSKLFCRFDNLKETITTGGFYKPLLLSMAVMSLYHFSGKLVCSMYAIDVISQITDNESSAYTGMLILDAVTIFGMQIGCVLSKIVNRKTLLLVPSAIGIIFLFTISIYLYLIYLNILVENKIISIVLLTLFSVSITCGPMLMPSVIFGDIIFLRYKSSSLLILTLFSQLLMATVLKLSPYIFKMLTLHGAFLFYAVAASFFALIVYTYLPETKDRTVQEIENYFKHTNEEESEVSKAFITENKDASTKNLA